MTHHPHDFIPTPDADAVEPRTDSFSATKRRVINWSAGIIGTALLGWGVFVTCSLYSEEKAQAVDHERIDSVNAQSIARDKSLTDIAAQASVNIQIQLSYIQAQLAEIQRDLRHGSRP